MLSLTKSLVHRLPSSIHRCNLHNHLTQSLSVPSYLSLRQPLAKYEGMWLEQAPHNYSRLPSSRHKDDYQDKINLTLFRLRREWPLLIDGKHDYTMYASNVQLNDYISGIHTRGLRPLKVMNISIYTSGSDNCFSLSTAPSGEVHGYFFGSQSWMSCRLRGGLTLPFIADGVLLGSLARHCLLRSAPASRVQVSIHHLSQAWLDAYSIFECDADGIIIKHTIDKYRPDKDRSFSMQTTTTTHFCLF